MLCDPENYPLLANIDKPQALRELERDQLQTLNDELREFLTTSIELQRPTIPKSRTKAIAKTVRVTARRRVSLLIKANSLAERR